MLGRVAVEVTLQSVISMSGAGPSKRRFALHGDLSRYNCFWNWAMLSNEVSPTPMFLIFAGVLVAHIRPDHFLFDLEQKG